MEEKKAKQISQRILILFFSSSFLNLISCPCVWKVKFEYSVVWVDTPQEGIFFLSPRILPQKPYGELLKEKVEYDLYSLRQYIKETYFMYFSPPASEIIFGRKFICLNFFK